MSGISYFGKSTPDVVLESLFSKYDKDKSGTLGRDELHAFMEKDLGLNTEEEEIYTMLNDDDGSNTWSFDEFKSWLTSSERFPIIDDTTKYWRLCQAVDMFEKYDHDETGSLDINELEKLLNECGYGVNDIESARLALDKDGNGIISFPEFLAWLNWV